MRLSWTPATHANTYVVVYYRVYERVLADGSGSLSDGDILQSSAPVSATCIQLHGLRPASSYVLQVMARNSDGVFGRASSSTFIQTTLC